MRRLLDVIIILTNICVGVSNFRLVILQRQKPISQLAFTCSKLTKDTLKQGVEYVQTLNMYMPAGLKPCQTTVLELFCRNSEWFLADKNFTVVPHYLRKYC